MKIERKYLFIVILIIIGIIQGCTDIESTFKEYLKSEKLYAGKLDSLQVLNGYKRVKIVGLTRYLGNSKECIVNWDGQSRIFPIEDVSTDKFEMIIDGLDERNYEFTVYTQDKELNKSVIQTCRGKAIGDIFKEAQTNRRITNYKLSGASLIVQWADKIESEYVVKTNFKYENNEGQMIEIVVLPNDTLTPLFDWKANGKIEICSAIITGDMGFDTIYLDPILSRLPVEFQLDKLFFKPVHLKNDSYGDGYGGTINGMWDGIKGSAQNSRYHSRDGEGVPHTITFDLGVIADLTRIEITGRENYHNWNPKRIQLWGCESIENKDMELPADHPDWEKEAIEKGWKLLLEADAPNPHENIFELDATKAKDVRYIRYRVLEVVGPPSFGKKAYGCVQEITLWAGNCHPVE